MAEACLSEVGTHANLLMGREKTEGGSLLPLVGTFSAIFSSRIPTE